MPNLENILAPITLVGNGRSGTSLISRVVSAHSDCKFAGETANLIHTVWMSLSTNLNAKKKVEIPDAIRMQFLFLFPTVEKRWLHKPIGVPLAHRLMADEDEFTSWYWQVMETVFPNACYLTVLRHPLDVLISNAKWWGNQLPQIVHVHRVMAKLLTHPDCPVRFAIDFHDFVADPEPDTRRLFKHLDLDYQPKCLEAIDKPHVLSSKDASADADQWQLRRRESFSHRADWTNLQSELLTPEYREAVEACWDRFGFDFGGWPDLR